jgi:putative membrane protein
MSLFLVLKAAHIVAVVSWMAGLFYLPRLFVYHVGAPVGGEASELFKVMERRLAKAIMLPAAVATWVTGGLTAWFGGYFSHWEVWLIVKVGLVLVLTVFHGWLVAIGGMFAADGRPGSSQLFRMANEIPTVILIGVVVLVVVRPF